MAKLINRAPVQGEKSLEIAVRESMEGLADSVAYFAYRSSPNTLEILSIEPAKTLNFEKKPAKIIPVKPSQDVTEYLIQREMQLERISAS